MKTEAYEYLKNGEFLKFKYPESIHDAEKMFFYSIECRFDLDENSRAFDPKEINYQTIIEINEQNKKYLGEFIFLFCKPTEDEIIEFLCNNNRFEDVIKIKNGEEYSNLLTKEEQKQKSLELWNSINELKKQNKENPKKDKMDDLLEKAVQDINKLKAATDFIKKNEEHLTESQKDKLDEIQNGVGADFLKELERLDENMKKFKKKE